MPGPRRPRARRPERLARPADTPACAGSWDRTVGQGRRAHRRGRLLYCLDSLILFRRFLASTFDLVIFDQGIRGYAHFRPPVSIARGVSDGQNAHFLLLADHWSPILALLAPLYWIHGSPATLLVAQGVLFALAIPLLWAYTAPAGAGAAYLVSVAYALSLPVMAAVVFDFHEVAFVPVLTAIMVEKRFGSDPPQNPPTRSDWPPDGVPIGRGRGAAAGQGGHGAAGRGLWRLPAADPAARRWTGLAFVVGGLAATWVARIC